MENINTNVQAIERIATEMLEMQETEEIASFVYAFAYTIFIQ